MSYSFNVRAPSKAEACTAVEAELAKVVASQPFHEADRATAQAAAESFVALLIDEPSMDVAVIMNGSVYMPNAGFQTVTVGITASLVPRT